jgi:4-hydroxybenzoate polyprenyltransferase
VEQVTASVDRGPSPGLLKAKGLIESFRVTTRIWFDTIAPLTFVALLTADGQSPDGWMLAKIVTVAVLFHGAGNYLNDVTDVEVDRASSESSRNQRAMVKGEITRRDLILGAAIMIAICFAIAATISWETVGLLVLLTLLNVAYNMPPVHLSSRGIVLELYWPLIWTFMFGMCAVALEVPRDDWLAALPYLLFVAVFMGVGEGITQDVRDADNDAAGGRNTTPVRYGVPKSVVAAWIVQLGAIGIWVWFCVQFPVDTVPAVLGTVALVAWQTYFARLAYVLVKRFEKRAAKLTHTGPIVVFSFLNLLLLATFAG